MKAVIQAGGRGTRLKPYTLVLPKPMMPVGAEPVIDILLKWLRRNGAKEVYITINYLGRLLKALCGDGSQWDMQITYCEEKEPLGTIGPLSLLRDNLTETFLVLNGDLITDLNLRSLVSFHKSHGGNLTVSVTKKGVHVDMGVIESDGSVITKFREKPTFEYDVSMGVYCMEPAILDDIPSGAPFGFDDLVASMLADGKPVHVYRHEGYWMDIGRPEDFAAAQKDFAEHRHKILGD
jgi:mannose-1-phosphate guanylyltransferase